MRSSIARQLKIHFFGTTEIAFAEEQTRIFDQMAASAQESLDQSPPDVYAAVSDLRYLHNYYPSGTKQNTGSRLDKIVERSRAQAETRVIEKLREATQTDLGNNADAWIQEFEMNQTLNTISKQ